MVSQSISPELPTKEKKLECKSFTDDNLKVYEGVEAGVNSDEKNENNSSPQKETNHSSLKINNSVSNNAQSAQLTYHRKKKCSEESIPESYVEVHKKHAAKSWENTKKWRREENVDNILSEPQPYFQKIKHAYPHIPHGYTKNGYPVIYERPGVMDLKQLFCKECKVPDMIRHVMFFMEYLSKEISTRPELQSRLSKRPKEESKTSWGFCVVMDLKGVSLSVLSGDVVRYLKQANHLNNAHYPTCLKGLYLANSPFWLAGAFHAIKKMGVLPRNANIEVMSSSSQGEILKKYIDANQIPNEYGGSSTIELGNHPFELDLWDLVKKNSSQWEDTSSDMEKVTSQLITKNVSTETQSETDYKLVKCLPNETRNEDDYVHNNFHTNIQVTRSNEVENLDKIDHLDILVNESKSADQNLNAHVNGDRIVRAPNTNGQWSCFPFCDPWYNDRLQSAPTKVLFFDK